MKNNVIFANNFSKEIYNLTQKFSNYLSRPQQGNLRELIRGMSITGSVHLSKIAKSNSTKIN